MATHEQIKAAILRVAGLPSSGVVADLADDFARAIVALDVEATKETRIMSAKERR
jgi:hypothetical protein